MIREPKEGDMRNVIALMMALHKNTHYARIKHSQQMGVAVVSRLMASPNGFVRVAEHDGKLTGLLLGLCEEYWWTDPKVGAKYASDLLFHSRRLGDGRRMMKEFIEWAWTRPRVVKLETAVSSGMIDMDKASRFYESLGFKRQGSLYVMDHPRLRNTP